MENRRPRVDDFLRNISGPGVNVPDPKKDFGMYEKMDAAMDGLHEYLDDLRRNQGRLGYSAQNLMSDLSKAFIDAVKNGDEDALAHLDNDMYKLLEGFDEAASNGEIAEDGNRFSHTMWQENMEAVLFGKIWPVITGEKDEVPNIESWEQFKGNVQAYLYGYLDVVSELGKALTDHLSRTDITITTEGEFSLYERYLVVAKSITLRLYQERHVPSYVISNAYGRWNAYSSKLRTAYGTIDHVRRELNLRRSMERMIKSIVAK